MLYQQVSLSLETYKNLLEKYGLGRPHTTLVGGEKWYPQEEKAVNDRRALDELHRCGLATGGRVHPDFLDTVTVLQRPGVELYTFARIAGATVTVRVASIGQDAVLAVSEGTTLDLYPAKADQLPGYLVGALPETPGIGIHSMSCAQADLDALIAGKTIEDSASSYDAKRVKQWLEAERRNAGQLYAAVLDGYGNRKRTPIPPAWVDTEAGRFLVAYDEAGWVSLAGASPADLVTKLNRMVEEVRGR